jgi:protein-S-isoprenylcysteine O-methyltransferase Ste14
VAQSALLAVFAGACWLGGDSSRGHVAARVGGLVLAAAGAVFFAASVRALGRALTPLPRPRAGGELVRGGPYALARHPIYGGVLAALLGLSIARLSWSAALVTALLAVLWNLKSRVEERWLEERYPGYADYRRRVRGRFLPFL